MARFFPLTLRNLSMKLYIYLNHLMMKPQFDNRRGKTKLLGSSQTRVLNLDEEIAPMNFLKTEAEEIDLLTVQAFPRLDAETK
jgi:hypothetical protein